jgi:hypothetical protein
MAEIIDLTIFRRMESQELSLIDLLEQAEALVFLQEAVLDECSSTTSGSQPRNRLMAVANSLQHLRRHLGFIKQMIFRA